MLMLYANVHIDVHIVIVSVVSLFFLFYVIIMLVFVVNVHINVHGIIIDIYITNPMYVIAM